MIKGIFSVHIAVKDLEKAIAKYEALLGAKAQFAPQEYFAFPGLKGASFDLNGVHISLLTSVEEGTPVAKVLQTRGEGVFLLSLEVDDFQTDVENLRAKGMQFISEEPFVGPWGKVNFVHPRSMHGLQIEIYEPAEVIKKSKEK